MKIRLILVYFIFLLLIDPILSQECRQVTVCNNDFVSSTKGDKGDPGYPGKSGPVGVKGEVGSRGIKGSKGNPCILGSFEEDVENRLAELKLLATPASCRLSSVYGRQTLRFGEEVFCDGGWTVVQKRFDGSVSFDHDWNGYKNGFGNYSGEFWSGLEKIHLMTRGRGCRVRFDLWSFEDEHAYAQYNDFYVEGESDNYRLHISGYSGTAGDSMTSGHSLNNMQFSTKDRDNDLNSGNCASSGVGWWFNSCTHVTINHEWGVSSGNWRNIVWFDWKGSNEALKETVMKIRCD